MSAFAWQPRSSAITAHQSMVADGAAFLLDAATPTANLLVTRVFSASFGTYAWTGKIALGGKVFALDAKPGDFALGRLSSVLVLVEIFPTDPVPYVENAWVQPALTLDAGVTVDVG